MRRRIGRARRRTPALAVGCGLVFVLAGCGGLEAEDQSTADPVATESSLNATAQGTTAVGGTPRDAAMDRQQRFEAQAACLTDKGFTSVAGPDGVMTEVAEDQDEAFMEASQQCTQHVDAQLGPDPAAAVLTEDELGEQYDALLGVRDCLVTAGHPVSDPPSRETWIASALLVQDALQEAKPGDNRAMDLPWNPYDDIQSVAATEQCPIPIP